MKNSTHRNKTKYEYVPDSFGSNIRYMLGMLAVIIIPPLLPGVTTRGLVMAYGGFALGSYVLALLVKLVMMSKQPGRVKRH